MGAFTFNAVRTLLGGVVLLPLAWWLNKGKILGDRKMLIKGGVLCGVILFCGSSLQQFGLMYTTVGKAGFITACYIVWVPLISAALGKQSGGKIWLAVILALAGLYLLSINEDSGVNFGDVLLLIGSVFFSLHILIIDNYSPQVEGVTMSVIQFFVSGALATIGMVLFEEPMVSEIVKGWQPLLYAGIMSSGVAYTLQIIGQKGIKPAVASLILSLESCIAVIAGWLLLGEVLSTKELLGCGLMFIAILLAQMPEKARECAVEGNG